MDDMRILESVRHQIEQIRELEFEELQIEEVDDLQDSSDDDRDVKWTLHWHQIKHLNYMQLLAPVLCNMFWAKKQRYSCRTFDLVLYPLKEYILRNHGNQMVKHTKSVS